MRNVRRETRFRIPWNNQTDLYIFSFYLFIFCLFIKYNAEGDLSNSG